MPETTRPSPALDRVTLAKGAHNSPDAGMCLLEAVSVEAGEPFSDHPACASPVLGTYGRNLNDGLPDDKRQELLPYMPRIVGTAGDSLDEARGYIALDWLIRTYTPAWLDLAGLAVEAAALRDLRRIVDLTAAQAAGPVVREAQTKARDAAGDAAWAAAWDAAGDAAWAAAWAAAWDAAGDTAGDAAWDAVRDAVRDAAWAAARDAVRAAARARLAPTVDLLQDSAIDLLDALIRGEFPAEVTA